jgi:hypothetical protein
LVNFVFRHSEVPSFGRPAEGSITVLVLRVFALTVVRGWKDCITVSVLITAIRDSNVVPLTEYWTIIWMVPNCIFFLSLNQSHFFLKIKLQQEGAAGRISSPLTIEGGPLEWSVCRDGFAELSADEGKSVGNIVAELVELGRFELMLRRSEEQLKSLWLVERVEDETHIFVVPVIVLFQNS